MKTSISVAPAPTEADRAIAEYLAVGGWPIEGWERSRPDSAEVYLPIPLFRLAKAKSTDRELPTGAASLASCDLVGWRYVVQTKKQLGFVDCRSRVNEDRSYIANFAYGDRVRRFIWCLKFCDKIEGAGTRYLRVLEDYPRRVAYLWLHSDDAPPLFVPLSGWRRKKDIDIAKWDPFEKVPVLAPFRAKVIDDELSG